MKLETGSPHASSALLPSAAKLVTAMSPAPVAAARSASAISPAPSTASSAAASSRSPSNVEIEATGLWICTDPSVAVDAPAEVSAAAAGADAFEACSEANGDGDSAPTVDSPAEVAAAAGEIAFEGCSEANGDGDSASTEAPGGWRPPECTAATKLQKVYKSYRTRRRLADSAVVAEELWWQAIDYARLSHSTVSFFNYQETTTSRWNRVKLNASKVGKGLSEDEKAQKLAFQHWIEAIDPRHRYGHNLHFYYEEWCKSEAGQPFFFWLDIGDGKNLDLEICPRSLLRQHCVKYLGPKEREHYEYVFVEGKIVNKKSGGFLDTSSGAKWIFVMSTAKRLYAGQKKKGVFHHSSFLAGGATLAAGRLDAKDGVLKRLSAYSGHYRPTEANRDNFMAILSENGIDLTQVQVALSSNEDYSDDPPPTKPTEEKEAMEVCTPPQPQVPEEISADNAQASEDSTGDEAAKEVTRSYRRTLSAGLQSPRTEVPELAIAERMRSKAESSSYQLGHQISRRWCSGAGPRIGCVADYPLELRA